MTRVSQQFTAKSGASSSTVGKEVGTIELKIVQAQRGPERPANPLAILPSASSVSSEWIKKTGGHCATFSKEEVPYLPQAPMTWSSKPLDVDNPHSYVKFVFHYRTLEWLQEHGIVPRSPSPAPSPSARVGLHVPFVTPATNVDPDILYRSEEPRPSSSKMVFAADPTEDYTPPKKPTKPRADAGKKRPRASADAKGKGKAVDEAERPKPELPERELTVVSYCTSQCYSSS